MNLERTAGILGLGLFLCQPADAVTVRECVDVKGEHTFAMHCQAQSREIAKKVLPGGAAVAAPKPAITLFVAQDCDSCDMINALLQKRGVVFKIKDVTTDRDGQAELRDRAGDLVVPTLTAGDKIVTGFNRRQINEALAAAGYPEPPGPTSTPGVEGPAAAP